MTDQAPRSSRVFLVVVDETEEMQAALRFACRRARTTGGKVALLKVIEPGETQQFAAIGNLMRAEAREQAESTLQRLAGEVNACAGQVPVLYVREGEPRQELLKLIEEEPVISILVLAADPGPHGPGDLVTALTGKHMGKLRIPVTIVPGNLTDAQIQAIT